MKKPPRNNGTLPLPCMVPVSDWKPPRISELPSLRRAKRIGFDTEGRDDTLRELGCGARRGAQICGFSFALEGDTRGYYVPIRHLGGDNVEDPRQAMAWLRDELWNFEGEIVMANGNWDLDVLNYEVTGAIKPNYNKVIIRDVQIADALINELNFKYNLDAILKRRGFDPKDESLLIESLLAFGAPGDHPKKIISVLPGRLVGPYGEYDAFGLLPLLRKQEELMKQEGCLGAWDIESRLLPVLLKIRQRGVLIDQQKLDYIDRWSMEEEQKVLSAIYQSLGVRLGLGQCWKADAVANVLEAAGVRVGKTDSGKPSITTAFLATLTHPIGKQIRRIRQVNKLRSTFVESIRRYMTGGRIHGMMRQIVGPGEKNEKSGAAFGRLSHCVAKGTLVEAVRDVSKFPKGIPIEDIRPGDLVYTYDHNLQLRLRPVKWAAKTGTKKVLRLHWRGTGRHHTGYTDVTPDHRVRTTSGKYVEARFLKKGDYVLALSRGICSTYGYARLWPTGAEEIHREHRFIWEETGHERAEHVHHINENKLDNRVENLQGLRANEHLAHHALENPADSPMRKKQGSSLKAKWQKDHERLKALCINPGEKASNWLGLTKEYLEDILSKNDWSITRAFKESGHDFQTFKGYCIRHGFDLEAMKQRNIDCRKSKGKYPHNKGNHEIISVEELTDAVDVYDLEVEDTHNFIANEICVHNCHPNTAQQPSAAEFAKMWRSIYLPEPGCEWGVCDLSQQEPRWTIHFAEMYGCKGAKEAADAYRNNPRTDNHDMTAKMTGLERKYAKAVFLALCYGEGGAKLCNHQLKLPTRWKVNFRDSEVTRYFATEAEAVAFRKSRKGKATVHEVAGEEGQKILSQFNERMPFVKELSLLASKKAEETGRLLLLGGRVLHFPLARDGSYDYTYKALNRIIQGSAGYQVKLGMIAIDREMPNTWIQLQRHDDLAGSFQSRQEAKLVAKIMTTVVKARVPFRCDVEMGTSDGDIHQLCAHDECIDHAVQDDPSDPKSPKYWCNTHLQEAA